MFNSIKYATVIGATLIAGAAMAQDYPEKPIEVIVGYSAGGGTDVMARTAAPFIEKYLGDGASLVVKNMPGASGQIGVTEVANADPDGYTLGTFNLPGMMARTIDRKADYSADSFTYLANVVNDPNVIVTSKRSGIETMDQLVEEARENPGAVTVGMSSLGGDDHFMLIKLQNLTETEFTIVPFRGSAPARTALMGGHVAMGILNISEVASFQDDLNVLGIATTERSDFAPDLPTFAEQGYELVNGSMRGFVAPKGLPEDVEAKLLAAFEQLDGDEEFLAAMAATSNPVEVVTGNDFKVLTQDLWDLAKGVWDETPWN
ncbi:MULTISPECIES: tripartite tricarboxylate transporter substrate binding protein [unclassified Salipiger]|uniref:Bug family tripartite tricarboxylate transporter substrate binding protein n=1 Tax=Roseobacteraceae TaxID=2854170 RepID=UPI0013BB126C|nr:MULTISPECIES: tripartite tricarboxylate transporter substrate binding protein [unclassified Salipiger]NDV51155.1 tripartite tricarboxylate transporter substrate binding protein [Salipiger sp. PrR003]NDW32924.1 tripartite tricarboxylate transporter substrate binding protein [Salipiger sp. PrR007]